MKGKRRKPGRHRQASRGSVWAAEHNGAASLTEKPPRQADLLLLGHALERLAIRPHWVGSSPLPVPPFLRSGSFRFRALWTEAAAPRLKRERDTDRPTFRDSGAPVNSARGAGSLRPTPSRCQALGGGSCRNDTELHPPLLGWARAGGFVAGWVVDRGLLPSHQS